MRERPFQKFAAKSPEARPQSAAEVGEELGNLAVRSEPLRWLRPAVAAVILLLAVAGAWLWYRSSSALPSLGTANQLGVTAFPGNEMDPSFSPDGSQVAFIWTGEKGDNYDIYTMAIGLQSPRRLTDNPADEEWPMWSPDGSQIAFLRRSSAPTWDLILIPAQGGPERRLTSVSLPPITSGTLYGALAWTPDSKKLVVLDLGPDHRRALFLFSLVDGSKRLLPVSSQGKTNTVNGSTSLYSPAASPNGRWLAFVDGTQTMVQRLTADYQPTGAPIPFPLEGAEEAQPAWVGDQLAVAWNQNATQSKIVLWDLKGPVQTVAPGRSLRRGFSVSTQGGECGC